uniref:Uncharacterized protein n=1 Tax=Mucochytrium quahogii TaxID=96639 RepID=A0A7S2SC25_9STRA|mmetsp:Transcript_3759/g.8181  ORF Transcript_3759/g.8181 Transcript_3759/m.8181 type:complete len:108 (+) Transcript_3759:96-419(+)
MRHILDELGIQQQPPSHIYTDSQAAIALIMSDKKTGRSKHIDVRRYKLRELVDTKEIQLLYIPGNINLSGIMTKNTGTNIFQRLCKQIYSDTPHFYTDQYFNNRPTF